MTKQIQFFEKLNGWQRIFVLISCLWGLGCIYLYELPDIFVPNSEFAQALKTNLKELNLNIPPWIKEETPIVMLRSKFGGIPVSIADLPVPPTSSASKKDMVEMRMQDGSLVWIDNSYTQEQVQAEFTKIKEGYKSRLFKKRAYSIIHQLFIFIIPLLGLYCLGWMFDWIIRGFKRKPN